MNNVKLVFFTLFPFLVTIFLWRLSVYFWNPGGILALIPIFYYTFVKQIYWFAGFALLFCFLIDYRCGLPLFWTSFFCLAYAINGFQKYVDVPHMDRNAMYLFMLFTGAGIFILIFANLTWKNLINNLWLFVWLNVLYMPITSIDSLFKYKRKSITDTR